MHRAGHQFRIQEFAGANKHMILSSRELVNGGPGNQTANHTNEVVYIDSPFQGPDVWFSAVMDERELFGDKEAFPNRADPTRNTNFAPKCGQCNDCVSNSKQGCLLKFTGDKVGQKTALHNE